MLTVEMQNRAELRKRYRISNYSVRYSGEVYVLDNEWRYLGHIDNPKLFP